MENKSIINKFGDVVPEWWIKKGSKPDHYDPNYHQNCKINKAGVKVPRWWWSLGRDINTYVEDPRTAPKKAEEKIKVTHAPSPQFVKVNNVKIEISPVKIEIPASRPTVCTYQTAYGEVTIDVDGQVVIADDGNTFERFHNYFVIPDPENQGRHAFLFQLDGNGHRNLFIGDGKLEFSSKKPIRSLEHVEGFFAMCEDYYYLLPSDQRVLRSVIESKGRSLYSMFPRYVGF